MTPLRRHADAAVLVLLAVVPALASSPGRMPADSKLYLYENPGALLADARWSYDTHQFGGWVTHQIVSYLWPAGPWFWLNERLGVPDWVAHRLWIAGLMMAAGLGMRWLARRAGLAPGAALVAALAYQCSPYLLPYVSRTSVMLLPWAGLPWLVGLARAASARGGWRDAAWFGLVVLTVGGVNLTATAMVAIGPLLWILTEVASGRLPVRRALGTLGRLGAVSAGASAWWLAAVAVQGKYGADVLTYSETLAAVRHTATAAEALRGQGYWLAYVDSPVPATTMARVYQHQPVLIGLGFLLAAGGIAGLALGRWVVRRFAALSVVAGTVLASAAHLGGAGSPVARWLDHHAANTVVLGLRSSTRAVPLVLLGLGLGLGALVHLVSAHCARPRLVSVTAGVLLVANLPVLWTFSLVDPANDRAHHPPAAWRELGRSLDADHAGGRVLQLPGAEFGAHTWGVTVDPVLAGLSRRSLLTRDLLPLGSPGPMDLLYALDDTIQSGTFEPASFAPVARLLGATDLVVPLDWDVARYDTFPPERFEQLVGRAPGVTLSGRAEGAWAHYSIDGVPGAVRAGASALVVVADGAGLVDAAAAGLIDGTETMLAAPSLTPDRLDAALAEASGVLITDQNRKRAHHWRTSQDVVGMTEDAGPATTSPDDGDHRLPVFPSQPLEAQTLAEQRGPVRAIASSYGSPVAYRPEDRAANAVDGDPTTAWRVGRAGTPEGQELQLTFPAPRAVRTLVLRQPDDGADRRIAAVSVVAGDRRLAVETPGDTTTVDLGGVLTDRVVVRIDRTEATGSRVPSDGVGFAEASVDGLVGDEVVVLPRLLDGRAGVLADDVPLAVVMTRQRVDRPDRERRDPETRLVREFSLPVPATLTLEVTGNAGPAPGPGCRSDLLSIDGTPVGLSAVTTAAGLHTWRTCDGAPLRLAAGPHRLETSSSAGAARVDRVVLSRGTWPRPADPVPVTVGVEARTRRTAQVGPCPSGCWVVLADGLNEGWRATVDGRSLGPPVAADAGLNGWWVGPTDRAVRFSAEWTPQRTTTLGLVATAITALVCLGLALWGRRRGGLAPSSGPVWAASPLVPTDARRRWILVAIAGGLTAALAGVAFGMLAAVAAGAAVTTRRSRVLALAATGLVGAIGLGYVARVVRDSPPPGFGWILAFEWAHRPALLAVVLLAVSVVDDAPAAQR